MIRQVTILLAFLLMLSSAVTAQDFDKGVAAYKAGDYGAALKEFRPLAESGNVSAQYNLGFMYDIGQGVIQDSKEAVKWYKLSAEQGHAKAQSNLGFMYDIGQGVIQDYAMAHMWFNIGAANGNEISGTNRDAIAKEMTSEDISKAQAMARKCMESNYKECGY